MDEIERNLFRISDEDEAFYTGVLLAVGPEALTLDISNRINDWSRWWDRRNNLLLTRSPYHKNDSSDAAGQWLRSERIKYNIWVDDSDGRRDE